VEIVVLGYDHPVDDKRVWRTVRTFAKHFDRVVYVYRHDDNKGDKVKLFKSKYPNIEFVPTYLRDRSFKGIWDYDRSVIDVMHDFVKADIWYLHTAPDLFPLRLFKLANKNGIRLIYDVHDMVPYELFARFANSRILDLGRKIALWPIFLRQIELSDETIVVSYAVRQYIRRVAPYLKTHIHVITNYGEPQDRLYWTQNREKKVVFVGWNLRPMPLWFIEELHRRYGYRFEYVSRQPIEEFKGKSWVKWHTAMPREELIKLLASAYFNLVVHEFENFGANSQLTAHNKFFDALAVGVPNLVREHFIELSAITLKFGVGCVGSLDSLLECAVPDNPKYWEYVSNIDRYYDRFVWGDRQERKLMKIVLNNG